MKFRIPSSEIIRTRNPSPHMRLRRVFDRALRVKFEIENLKSKPNPGLPAQPSTEDRSESLRFVPVELHPGGLQFSPGRTGGGGWMERIPFHCLHSFAKRSGGLLGRRLVQPKSQSWPRHSATPADGKVMETRESALESPGLGFRVRSSDLFRISELGFRIFAICCLLCGLLLGASAAQEPPEAPTPFLQFRDLGIETLAPDIQMGDEIVAAIGVGGRIAQLTVDLIKLDLRFA